TDRGWVAYFNDLHKGRSAGAAWAWFIDAFAVTALIFCITGLFLLHLHAGNRPLTWPLVGAGLVVPLLLALAFIH
ncbi:MAG TPA: PepSY-associated TM helix domain-containing protein, partial [Chitinolyticbacter sp.]|nr:PepSY-associated TM helix domain-containing protein [Chitinolyticbacter sp.]